jgi:hypothetical protein
MTLPIQKEFDDYIDSNVHIVVGPFSIYAGAILVKLPNRKKYTICLLNQLESHLKFVHMSFKAVKKFVLENCSDVEVRYPTNWDTKKKGRLMYELDPANYSNESFGVFLCLLL